MSAGDGETHAAGRGGILRRGWITLLGAALGALLVFGNEIIVARNLGVPLYGLYALALVVARIAETICLFGLRSGMMHFLPVYLKEGQRAEALGTIAASLLPPIVLGLSAVAAIWTAAPWMASVVLKDPAATPYLRLFALPIPLMCTIEMLGVVTRGFGYAEYYVVIRNLTPPISYMIMLLMLLASGGDPLLVAKAFGLSQLIASLVGVAVVVRLVRGKIGWTRPAFPFRSLYVYSFPIMLNTLLYVLMSASDILMLGSLRGAAEAGVFRACLQLRPAFDMAVLAFNAAAIHLYPIFHREGRHAELARSYQTVVQVTSSVTFTLFVLVLLSRRDILALLGPDFPAGADAMVFLLLGFLVQGCIGSAGILLVVTGHQKQETFNALIGVVINIGLNFLLIPSYGMIGAGVATALALLILNLLRERHVRTLMHLNTLRPNLLRAFGASALVGITVLGLGHWFGFADGTGTLPMILRTLLASALLGLMFWQLRRSA